MVTVIVALPSDTPVIRPLVTVATLLLLDVQVTVLFVAFDGAIVAAKVSSPPTETEVEFLFNDTPVTETVVPPPLKSLIVSVVGAALPVGLDE